MNIFLTGDSKGIGKVLYDELKKEYNIFGVSRTGEYKYNLIKDIDKLSDDFKDKVFDVIVLNAGIGDFNFFKDGDLNIYEDIINLNLISNIKLLKKLHYHAKSKIIFIGSIIGKKFMKQASVYQASKFGLRGFAGALKKEGYKIFLLNPKIVDTCFHPDYLDLSYFSKTDIKDIVKTIKNIIKGEEKRFEIDL